MRITIHAYDVTPTQLGSLLGTRIPGDYPIDLPESPQLGDRIEAVVPGYGRLTVRLRTWDAFGLTVEAEGRKLAVES